MPTSKSSASYIILCRELCSLDCSSTQQTRVDTIQAAWHLLCKPTAVHTIQYVKDKAVRPHLHKASHFHVQPNGSNITPEKATITDMLAHLTARGRHVFIHALAGEHIGTYLQTIITGDKQLPQTAQAHTHTHTCKQHKISRQRMH